MDTLYKGDYSDTAIFASLFREVWEEMKGCVTLKEKNLLSKEQILFFKSNSDWRRQSTMEANTFFSTKVFPYKIFQQIKKLYLYTVSGRG